MKNLTGLMEPPLEITLADQTISIPAWTKETGLLVTAFWTAMYHGNSKPEERVCSECGQFKPTGFENVDGLLAANREREIEEIILGRDVYDQLVDVLGANDLYNLSFYVATYRLAGEAAADGWLEQQTAKAAGTDPKGHRKPSKNGQSTE